MVAWTRDSLGPDNPCVISTEVGSRLLINIAGWPELPQTRSLAAMLQSARGPRLVELRDHEPQVNSLLRDAGAQQWRPQQPRAHSDRPASWYQGPAGQAGNGAGVVDLVCQAAAQASARCRILGCPRKSPKARGGWVMRCVLSRSRRGKALRQLAGRPLRPERGAACEASLAETCGKSVHKITRPAHCYRTCGGCLQAVLTGFTRA